MSTPESPRKPPPPPQLPTEPLRQRGGGITPGPAIATGLVALLIGGALLTGGVVGYLIGNSSENEHTPAATHMVTNTTTVVHPKTVVQTQTVMLKTVKKAPSPANQANETRLREIESQFRKVNKELERKHEEGARGP
jgi:hypothetical protein